jgi:hypothetical protein
MLAELLSFIALAGVGSLSVVAFVIFDEFVKSYGFVVDFGPLVWLMGLAFVCWINYKSGLLSEFWNLANDVALKVGIFLLVMVMMCHAELIIVRWVAHRRGVLDHQIGEMHGLMSAMSETMERVK